MRPNLFGFLLVILRFTCSQSVRSKASEHLGYFPRQFCLDHLPLFSHTRFFKNTSASFLSEFIRIKIKINVSALNTSDIVMHKRQ
jgi:hypothetical protein